jgi:hypothetical protein
MARASLRVMVAFNGVPLGPEREKWKGGGTAFGSALGLRAFGLADVSSGSPSSPLRPPSWVVSTPSPSMKKVSEPCFISCDMNTPFRPDCRGVAIPKSR